VTYSIELDEKLNAAAVAAASSHHPTSSINIRLPPDLIASATSSAKQTGKFNNRIEDEDASDYELDTRKFNSTNRGGGNGAQLQMEHQVRVERIIEN
jgi:hypothetical protein